LFVDNLSLAFGLGGVVRGFEEKAYGGSKKKAIQELIAKICDLCVEYRISLIVVWIPREWNLRADYLSKLTSHYDFKLRKYLFEMLERRWGAHTIDRFSTAASVLVKSGRFNSRFWQCGKDGCQGVDAFLQDWSGENNWIHPPYKLVGRAVQHLRACKAVGTVVMPAWPKQAWWPLVVSGGVDGRWSEDVVDWVDLGHAVGWNGQSKGALVPPEGESLTDLPRAHLWAVRFDCR